MTSTTELARPEPPAIRFRVHFADGAKIPVTAPDATAARSKAGQKHQGRIIKVKRDREV